MTWLANAMRARGATQGAEEGHIGRAAFEQVFELRPNLHAAYREFAAVFWERRLLPPELLELVRLRVAQLLECRVELAIRHRPAIEAGFDEDKVRELPRWATSTVFTACERACLDFADQFVADAQHVTDAQTDALVEHLGPEGAVALTEAIALFDGFGRFQRILGIEPESDEVTVVPAPSLPKLPKRR